MMPWGAPCPLELHQHGLLLSLGPCEPCCHLALLPTGLQVSG
jgi:hypothetical protein